MSIIPSLIGDVIETLRDLSVDPDQIKEVAATLDTNRQQLEDSDFLQRFSMSGRAFGGSEQGGQLDLHHGMAQEIIADTLRGVVTDLDRFARGVERAVTLVGDADTGNAASLQARQQAVDVLAGATGHSEADRRNRESRNDNLGPGSGGDA